MEPPLGEELQRCFGDEGVSVVTDVTVHPVAEATGDGEPAVRSVSLTSREVPRWIVVESQELWSGDRIG